MVNLSGLIGKAKQMVQKNPDALRSGVEKVRGVVDDKTKGKYSDQLAKGSEMVDKALGVPGQTRDAYRDEASTPTPEPDPVKADPIEPPEDIEPPRPV
ncbi:antitoxin [Gephyromycinifex aptenodytis]|uniref:antitoxin n=1 Tax=Gephyromycinifex aptenodytis TaxID=2716227 RepID=UPI0014462A03|nr:antitoxin [Gephyromycinifex aptenodytis]